MRTHIRARGIRTLAAAAGAAVIMAGSVATQAEAGWPPQHEHGAASAPADDHFAVDGRPDVTARQRHMMEERNAAETRLRLLVEKMNAATGQSRMDAMAAVIAELVNQHSTMRAQMEQMARAHGMMDDAMSDMREMRERCPMMTGKTAPPKP